MILPCTCVHKDQDEIHGKGRRVHNPCGKSGTTGQEAKGKPLKWRCTVCLHEKDAR